MPITPDQREAIKQLASDGLSHRAIAKMVGMQCHSSVGRLLREEPSGTEITPDLTETILHFASRNVAHRRIAARLRITLGDVKLAIKAHRAAQRPEKVYKKCKRWFCHGCHAWLEITPCLRCELVGEKKREKPKTSIASTLNS